jgi:hypothetical protein
MGFLNRVLALLCFCRFILFGTFSMFQFSESWIRINVIDYTANGWSSLGKYWELGLSMCQQDCDGAGAFW